MSDVKLNLKCIGCNQEDECTEHMARCSKCKELATQNLQLDEDGRMMRMGGRLGKQHG